MLGELQQTIHACSACPRLRQHCLETARVKRRAYRDETYWGKPISGFGDPQARLVIVGLAPAAHGANRTGRIFTGDESGRWLYRALHKAGFASQAESVSRDDGLSLRDCYISCVVKCAPPDNKPAPEELKRCSGYLRQELELLDEARVYMALGGIALQGLWPLIGRGRRPKFAHGASVELADGRWLLMSYHPSQQNTFTRRLTEPMFDSLFALAQKHL